MIIIIFYARNFGTEVTFRDRAIQGTVLSTTDYICLAGIFFDRPKCVRSLFIFFLSNCLRKFKNKNSAENKPDAEKCKFSHGLIYDFIDMGRTNVNSEYQAVPIKI